MSTDAAPVIVFDGVCVLCSRWVDFILDNDSEGRFRLAAMQGEHGRALLFEHGLLPDDPSSFLLVQEGRGYTDTDAIARVLSQLSPGWRLTGKLMLVVPRALRNAAYRWIARHRYRLFGRREQCRLPDPAQAWRFID